jgi:type IV fimbrial biogenesis protein FimT
MHTGRQRGVTLIETGVVAAVAAITLSTAAPDFRRFIEKQRLDGVAAQFANDIRFARSEAVMRNGTVRLSVHAGSWGSCYVIQRGAADECSCSADGPARCTGAAVPLKTVVLPAAEKLAFEANVASILFDPLHGTSTPAGTLKVVTAGGRAVHHVVNVMGRVRSCSPRLVAPAVPGYAVC